jgi:hypothetical protein
MRKHPILTLIVILMLAGLACNANPFGSDDPTQEAATEEPRPTREPDPEDTPVPPPTPEPEDTATPIPPTVESRSATEFMESSSQAMDEVDSFQLTMDLQISMGGEGLEMEIPMTFEGVVQAPDMTAGTLSLSFLGISMESEMVSVGETTYMTNPETGEWEISSDGGFFGLGELGGGFASPDSLLGNDEDAFTDLVVVGDETLDGVPVVHLQGFMVMDEAEGGGDFSVDIWIGAEDNFLYQLVLEGQTIADGLDDSLFGAGGGEVSMLITMNMSNFNEPVDIQIPNVIADTTIVPPTTFSSPIQSVAFSADGQLIAAGGTDGSIHLWSLDDPTTELFAIPAHSDWIRTVAFSPDGQWLASGGDDSTIMVWSAENPASEPVILEDHEDWVRSVAFSPDSDILASGSDDHTVRLWNPNDFSAAPVVLPTNGFIFSVAFTPDGNTLAAGGDEGVIYLWDLLDLNAPPTLIEAHDDWIRSIAISPDGVFMASGSDDGTVLLWDMNDLNAAPHPFIGHTDWVRSVAFTNDGSALASSSDDMTILVWDPYDVNELPITLTGHTDWVMSVDFSPVSFLLASGSDDGTARIWSSESPGDHQILGGGE